MKKWANIIAVQKMQQYIEDNLFKPITLEDLARCSNYSVFYSAKIFKELTGKSPFEYLRILRLSQAALKLRDENLKVIDIALDCSFDSHEGFTRAFHREFGLTPKQYKKRPVPIELFMPNPISDYYRLKREERELQGGFNQAIFVQVVQRPQRKLILKRGVDADNYIDYIEEVGDFVWGVLCSIKEAINKPMGMWLPDVFRPSNTSYYVQGVEVPFDYQGVVPQGFDIIQLPPCKLMVFHGQPYDDEECFYVVDEMREAIRNYQPENHGFVWAEEEGPHIQMEPLGWQGYIEAKPVKQLDKTNMGLLF